MSDTSTRALDVPFLGVLASLQLMGFLGDRFGRQQVSHGGDDDA